MLDVGCWLLEPLRDVFSNVGHWMKCLILIKTLHPTYNISKCIAQTAPTPNIKYLTLMLDVEFACASFSIHCNCTFSLKNKFMQ